MKIFFNTTENILREKVIELKRIYLLINEIWIGQDML